jgi:hypothetical protein
LSASVLYMSMSLAGYIAGPNDELGQGLGEGGERLHYWGVTPDGEFFRPAGSAGQLIDEMNATGAVLADGGLPSSSITGAVIITAHRSSSLVTGRLVHPPRTIRW